MLLQEKLGKQIEYIAIIDHWYVCIAKNSIECYVPVVKLYCKSPKNAIYFSSFNFQIANGTPLKKWKEYRR
jgi:hypothetical protein